MINSNSNIKIPILKFKKNIFQNFNIYNTMHINSIFNTFTKKWRKERSSLRFIFFTIFSRSAVLMLLQHTNANKERQKKKQINKKIFKYLYNLV